MKLAAIIVLALLVAGCASKRANTDDPTRYVRWSLFHHLETKSEWGAVQGGISICLRETENGIALVIRNDGMSTFEIDPFFGDGYNLEIQAYDENGRALSPTFYRIYGGREEPPLVKLEPGKEFVSGQIYAAGGYFKPPLKTKKIVAMWYRNALGTSLNGPVITGPMVVKSCNVE